MISVPKVPVGRCRFFGNFAAIICKRLIGLGVLFVADGALRGALLTPYEAAAGADFAAESDESRCSAYCSMGKLKTPRRLIPSVRVGAMRPISSGGRALQGVGGLAAIDRAGVAAVRGGKQVHHRVPLCFDLGRIEMGVTDRAQDRGDLAPAQQEQVSILQGLQTRTQVKPHPSGEGHCGASV